MSLKDLIQGEMKIACIKDEDLGNIFCREVQLDKTDTIMLI